MGVAVGSGVWRVKTRRTAASISHNRRCNDHGLATLGAAAELHAAAPAHACEVKEPSAVPLAEREAAREETPARLLTL